MPAHIDARLFYGNLFYSGRVSNASDSGMFIRTERSLSADAMVIIIIRLENKLLKVIAKVKHIASTDGNITGIGVALLSPSRNYLDLVNNIKIV